MAEAETAYAVKDLSISDENSYEKPDEEFEEGEIESEAENNRSPDEVPVVHPLEQAWIFWFDNPSAKLKLAAWCSWIHPAHTFSTVEDFWSLYNNIHHPSKLVVGADFYCFKDKIEPNNLTMVTKVVERLLMFVQGKKRFPYGPEMHKMKR